ncbi:MAG: site-2 protease family protein [Deltaproteobacteria bacterium]|nr:site-2 protease family protein [Deltaproteobacteria bacterium]
MITPFAPATCPTCGTELAPRLLACPACGRLVHGDELRAIVTRAEAARAAGDATAALVEWRRALELVPDGSAQHQTIRDHIQALGREVDGVRAAATAKPNTASPLAERAQRAEKASRRGPIGAILAALVAVLLKGKFAILFLLGKLKFVLLGFTKLGTLSSMLLSVWVYASMWGWKYAVGLIVSLYLHEMGHVAALSRYGVRATTPMFVPMLGAYVRLQQPLTDPVQDARTGLAGPVWGLVAAVVAYVVFHVTREPLWAAIAGTGAFLNLFNLVPIWALDGSRGFRSMSRMQRWIAVLVAAGAFAVTREGLLAVIAAVAALRAFRTNPEGVSDSTGTALYCWLVATLSVLAFVAHAGAPHGR